MLKVQYPKHSQVQPPLTHSLCWIFVACSHLHAFTGHSQKHRSTCCREPKRRGTSADQCGHVWVRVFKILARFWSPCAPGHHLLMYEQWTLVMACSWKWFPFFAQLVAYFCVRCQANSHQWFSSESAGGYGSAGGRGLHGSLSLHLDLWVVPWCTTQLKSDRIWGYFFPWKSQMCLIWG